MLRTKSCATVNFKAQPIYLAIIVYVICDHHSPRCMYVTGNLVTREDEACNRMAELCLNDLQAGQLASDPETRMHGLVAKHVA